MFEVKNVVKKSEKDWRKTYYSSHWKVLKTPDLSQKLSNNQLSKVKFRGQFLVKNYLILHYSGESK